jgi:hypothetical protein
LLALSCLRLSGFSGVSAPVIQILLDIPSLFCYNVSAFRKRLHTIPLPC